MGAIGRNEPCPCGSGKKYKHCCLGKEPPPRMTAVFDEIRAAIAGKDFKTIDEANAFLQGFMESKNCIPHLDFLGLSPEQMGWIIYSPYEKMREIVEINPDVAPDVFRGIPMVENVLLFLGMLAEQEPLKATAKGNLPLSFAGKVFVEMKMPEREFYRCNIRSEDESLHLRALRETVMLCRWIKKQNNRFSLTENSSRIIQRGFTREDFQNLLEKFTIELNWACMDRYPPFQIVQSSFLFGLYILHRRAGGEIEDQALTDCFLRAFPQALEEADRYEMPYQKPLDLISNCFSLRFLERFCEYFGFASIRREAIPGRFIKRKFVQTTDFFRQYLQWRV
ncbi:MAG: SEC-C domain-containing protein [Deltaproteobacteria bacterium]|nr:SEC-C domain-containing protein [Deltaproteobacteria bacterium]